MLCYGRRDRATVSFSHLHDIFHLWNPLTPFCMTYLITDISSHISAWHILIITEISSHISAWHISSLKSHHTFLHGISHLITEIPSHISVWHISSHHWNPFAHSCMTYLINEILSNTSAWHITKIPSYISARHISSLKSFQTLLHDISHH